MISIQMLFIVMDSGENGESIQTDRRRGHSQSLIM